MQRKKNQCLLILTEIALVLFLAAASAYAGETNWARYFPYKIGNSWVYETNGCGDQKVDVLVKVTGSEKIHGKQCHVFESFSGNRMKMKEYYEMAPQGLIAHKRVFHGGTRTINLVPEQFMLSFPLVDGKTWKWTGQVKGKQKAEMDFKVVGTETVTVPAGVFKTIKVRMEGTRSNNLKYVSFRWYAENVGMVKEESTVMTGSRGMTITAMLKSYTLLNK